MPPVTPLVVGIGASAGGIPALEGFFRNLSDDSGMAFIIATHLSPDRRSLLHEVIGRYTSLPVYVAEDGADLQANTVYVMPEGKILTIRDGCLRLSNDDPVHRERKIIDVLFASMAEDLGENAVGIVLSGGDSDGTLGVKAIKEHGGITMAQVHDESGPRNPEMPDSAMASGHIDFAEPVEQMPERLLRLRNGIGGLDVVAREEADRPTDEALRVQAEISDLLRRHTGRDFSGYKHKTFLRRVARRMKVADLTMLDAYVERLRADSAEVLALFRDLLINVTDFFRDTDAFSALKSQVVPRLFEERGAHETIRLWVPGCATGEEAYSLGILMREYMEGLNVVPRVQIFATDIDDEALSAARAGRYPDALLAGMEPERRERFFRRDGASNVVSKEVREMCIFSSHSVISDPPFSRMDLVSCRNLLIYMGGDLQSQVIPTFHYALKPGGYLFLGISEGVSRHSELFAPVDKQHRIFQSRDLGRRSPRMPVALQRSDTRPPQEVAAREAPQAGRQHIRQRVETQVLDRHAPAHVVVTTEGEVLYYSANTGRFLEMPRGAPSRQLLDLARRELRADLRTALRQAVETGRPAARQVLMIDRGGETGSMIGLTVEPLNGPSTGETLLVALFTTLGEWRQPYMANGVSAGAAEVEAALERELRDLRERLQSTIEEYETAIEELKASNEELISVNEEAQSANEELEASREEMQSLNEELSTINAELSTSVEELDAANTDLKNVYAATDIATVFLDGDLVVRSFTPAAASFFHLRETDVGRPLTELAGALQYPDLATEAREVFRSGQGVERRVSAGGDRKNHLVRVTPYRDHDDDVAGLVLTIVDVSSLARAEAHREELFTAAQRMGKLGHWHYDLASDRFVLSDSVHVLLGDPGKTLDMNLQDLLGRAHPEDRELLREALARIVEDGSPEQLEGRITGLDEAERTFWFEGHRMLDAGGMPIGAYGALQDVTQRRRDQEQLLYLAHHDALTGLANRTILHKELERALAAPSPGRETALLFLDLDEFKAVNDSLGHSAGDRLLVKVAERLRTLVRSADSIARFGGDEFAIVAQVNDQQEAASLADRILEGLKLPFALDDRSIHLGASIGLVMASAPGARPDDILRDADIAMYRAKAEGKGVVRVFASQMGDTLKERQQLKHELKDALQRGELFLEYQPLIDLATSRILGFEALLRWNHPAKGLVLPTTFIPIAEEAGSIVEIGEWVLAQACREAMSWPPELFVAVNLSPVQFRSGKLVETVERCLSNAGLPAKQLQLEITESILLIDSAANLEALHALRSLNVSISLDDFGTGYSSLSYLRSFPVDKIKIDRTFVSDLAGAGGSGEPNALVRAIIDLARGFGIRTTAEGVETEDQANVLREMGCEEGQGYLYSRPKPAPDIPAVIARAEGA